ncbi:hypothetical protein [Pseudoxanthomonas sacheonensis]|uniref:DUF2946 domain-containing protein n=1 Tax=Pseudoxanthomonas sacheonensis TaxID=443615 RepID=A0ABU1RUL8_9GAMM|nr:hypothetical protein [Pseudoxanthomonas sacheonensis]MDR6842010.1 hypothetical protein [Pseudoxanthomonas sacheonensis]
MIRILRYRIVRLLRLPALALLVLAVLVNPVFAAVGDLHEFSRGGTGHAQASDSHDHADESGTQQEGTDLLHALMHAAHCCGHLTAILSTPFVAHTPSFTDAVPASAFAAPHSPPRTDHFRPPIAI